MSAAVTPGLPCRRRRPLWSPPRPASARPHAAASAFRRSGIATPARWAIRRESEDLRGLTIPQLVNAARIPAPRNRTDVLNATRLALRSLARRLRPLDPGIAELDTVLRPLVAKSARTW